MFYEKNSIPFLHLMELIKQQIDQLYIFHCLLVLFIVKLKLTIF